MNAENTIIDIESKPTDYPNAKATVIVGVNSEPLKKYYQFTYTADFFFSMKTRHPSGIGAYFIVKPKTAAI